MKVRERRGRIGEGRENTGVKVKGGGDRSRKQERERTGGERKITVVEEVWRGKKWEEEQGETGEEWKITAVKGIMERKGKKEGQGEGEGK